VNQLTTVLCVAAIDLAFSFQSIRITAAARSVRPGELVVLTLAGPSPANALRVRAFDRDWPVFAADAGTAQALIGIDLDVAPGSYVAVVDAGATAAGSRTTYALTVRSRVFPTRRLTVDEAFVTPPASAANRIAREAEQLNLLWRTTSPIRRWDGPFTRPVPDEANSAFGTRSVFNGQPRSPHGGADFLSRTGTPVVSPNAGRVALAGDLYYTGNTVVIDHGLGLYSLFAHLSEIDVEQGADVLTGQRIGLVGATGRVTGPHLHWAVRLCGARVDPLSLLDVLGKTH